MGNRDIVEARFREEMEVIVETDKAIGLSFDGEEVDIWLPKSQVEETITQHEVVESVCIPIWLAEEKGLNY